jgi:hypothetical protein
MMLHIVHGCAGPLASTARAPVGCKVICSDTGGCDQYGRRIKQTSVSEKHKVLTLSWSIRLVG